MNKEITDVSNEDIKFIMDQIVKIADIMINIENRLFDLEVTKKLRGKLALKLVNKGGRLTLVNYDKHGIDRWYVLAIENEGIRLFPGLPSDFIIPVDEDGKIKILD